MVDRNYQVPPEQPPGFPPPLPFEHVRVTVPLELVSVNFSPVVPAVETSE